MKRNGQCSAITALYTHVCVLTYTDTSSRHNNNNNRKADILIENKQKKKVLRSVFFFFASFLRAVFTTSSKLDCFSDRTPGVFFLFHFMNDCGLGLLFLYKRTYEGVTWGLMIKKKKRRKKQRDGFSTTARKSPAFVHVRRVFFFLHPFLPLMQSALLQQMMERGGGGDGRCEKQEDAPPQSEPSETA